jgi:hypothetical protein
LAAINKMTLLEVSIPTYVPTTVLGLLGLISGYLFIYFKNKNNNKVKEIESANPKDRIKAIEMSLNELGITIDTKNLSSDQKLEVIKNLLRTKTNRLLIISITSIVFTILVTFLISNNKTSARPNPNQNSDSTKIDSGKQKTIPETNSENVPAFSQSSTSSDTMAAIIKQFPKQFADLKGKRLPDQLGLVRYKSLLSVGGMPAEIYGSENVWTFSLHRFDIRDSTQCYELGLLLGNIVANANLEQLNQVKWGDGYYYHYVGNDCFINVMQGWSKFNQKGSVWLKIEKQ